MPKILLAAAWVFFRIHSIIQDTVFQGQSGILGSEPSHPGVTLPSMPSDVPAEELVARAGTWARAFLIPGSISTL